MDIYSLFGNIGFVLVLNKEVNQIKHSARLKENLQKILGLDCYHKTWITISKPKDEEITLTMLFFSKKEFACFERKIDKKYIVEKEKWIWNIGYYANTRRYYMKTIKIQHLFW